MSEAILLPQAPDAEKCVLASFFMAPKQVGGYCAEKQIPPAAFHVPAHAEIYRLLMEFWKDERPIECLSIVQALKDRGKLESVGGFGAVSELTMFLPTAANAKHYLSTVQDKYKLREVIRVGTEYVGRGYSQQDNPEALLDGFERDTLAIRRAASGPEKQQGPKELAFEAISAIQRLYDRKGKIGGLETGFGVLDRMTDGLHGANMYIVAARPSMGKTALAMNIAEHLSMHCKKPVGVFSLEMSAQQLAQRSICSMARVNLARVRDGFLTERDFPAITAAGRTFAESSLWIDDRSGLTIDQVRAKARLWKSEGDVQAIFLDYIGLLRSNSKRSQDNRQLEISEYSAGLKALSKELNIPVVVLAQLNRNPDSRGGEGTTKGRPRLSDLRESGSIEQDADFVGLLHREEYYAETEEQKEDARGKATLIIAKQRNGPIGDVPLTFLKEFTRFEDRAEAPEPE